jgi:cephalosporin hydroxylase
MDEASRRVVDAFHDLYYNGLPGEGPIFQRTFWMGVPCLKCPLDLWIYQELLHEVRPGLVIETGTHLGGSALFLAHVMDTLNCGEIISIDINSAARPEHHRIRYVKGSSTDPGLIEDVLRDRPSEVRMIILDSDHSEAHVSREIDLLSPYVTVGSYLIVEDTNINGNPTYPEFGPGPMEAVKSFCERTDDFIIDASREKFLMTFNPKGFLKRVR